MAHWLAHGVAQALAIGLSLLPMGELPVLADPAVEAQAAELPALWDLALRQSSQGQPEAALATYAKALALARRAKYRVGEVIAFNGVAGVYRRLGKPEEALKNYQKALEIARKVRDRDGEALTLDGMAGVYHGLGRLEDARKNYQNALEIALEVNDRHGEAATLHNIAGVYRDMGKPEEALKNYKQALEIARQLKSPYQEGVILNGIGVVQAALGKPEEALKNYKQALAFAREVNDRRREGIVLKNIGGVYLDLLKPEEALKNYKQALEIFRVLKFRRGEGATLQNIAERYFVLGKPEEALKTFQQALEIWREVKDSIRESSILSILALLQRDQQQAGIAIENLQKAMSIQLEVRRGLQRRDRESFLNQSQLAGVMLVGLLIEQQRAADAFRWVNLFGSADLADYSRLIEARVSDPEAQQALDEWRQRQLALKGQRQRLEREPDERRMQQLVEQEAAQIRAAEALIGRYPVIAELLETRPADLERLQAGIPAGTVVLQPALLTGIPRRADTVALFVLSRSDLQVVPVPLPPQFTALVEAYRQDLEQGEPYLERSQQLYELLIRPLENRGLLPAGGRLAVITTGKLREIPLETLYDGRTKQFLIEKYPIHYLTRLSRNAAAASRPSGAGAVDPGSGAGGPRRALVLANPTPTARNLPGTEAEANYLVGAYPGSRILRRNQATLEQFQQQANRYPILHLGTHGCFVAAGCPELGMKANTLLFANGAQYPIAEAAQLGLTHTELLVLAACQTARIIDDSDVGISGLAYVWERAGARAVVASLWSARDEESSTINQAFYGNLKAGMDKAEAMRQAKLALLHRDPDGMHPYLWAPFIVIGDSAPLGK